MSLRFTAFNNNLSDTVSAPMLEESESDQDSDEDSFNLDDEKVQHVKYCNYKEILPIDEHNKDITITVGKAGNTKSFVIKKHVAFHSNVIKKACESDTTCTTFTFENITPELFEHIETFLNKYAVAPFERLVQPPRSENLAEIVGKWYADFITHFSFENICVLMSYSSNDLDISPLTHLAAARICLYFKEKTDEELHTMFGELNDLIPEVTAEIELGDQEKIDNLVQKQPKIIHIKPKEPEDITTTIVENQCIICVNNKKCVVFNDCHHVNTCYTCSKTLKECPICRQKIKDKIYLYL